MNAQNSTVKINIKFDRYNFRRYGRPWLAQIVTRPNGGVDYKFVERAFVGSPEEGGIISLELPVGIYCTYGQKDHRGNNSVNQWIIIDDKEENGYREVSKADGFAVMTQ